MTRSQYKPDPYMSWGLALAAVLFVMYVFPGFLSPVTSHFDGSCRALPMQASAGDLRIDPTTGLAYLSYYNRLQPEGAKKQHGSVMLIDLNAAEPRVRAALSTEPQNFEPYGISLYVPESGPKRLFVVNRAKLGEHSIEIFEQSVTGAFAPVESIRNRLLWSPNAIVAVGPRQFYVTNDAGFKDKDLADPSRYEQGRLRRNRSTVLYFDGERMKQVAQRLDMANGIALSPDGRTVYVSESMDRALRIFDRDIASGELKMREVVPLDSTPDNLTVDAAGDVWIGSHPRMVAILQNLRDASSRSPTQVLKYSPGAEAGKRLTEVYANDGEELSAGSVAATRGNLLVIGSVTDQKLLLCTQGGSGGAGKPTPPAITGPEKET
jgi:arylesterase/paraoxonase